MRGVRDRANIDHAQQGIAGRFDPHQLRFRLERGAQLSRVALIDEIHHKISLRVQRREQAVGAAVAVVRREHARPGRERRQDQGDGGQPGASHNCAGAAFQIRQCVGQLVARRIAGTRVVVLARLTVALKCKITRQVNRRHHGAVVRRPTRDRREPIESRCSWASLCSWLLLRKGVLDNGCEGRAFFQEGVMAKN